MKFSMNRALSKRSSLTAPRGDKYLTAFDMAIFQRFQASGGFERCAATAWLLRLSFDAGRWRGMGSLAWGKLLSSDDEK